MNVKVVFCTAKREIFFKRSQIKFFPHDIFYIEGKQVKVLTCRDVNIKEEGKIIIQVVVVKVLE